MTAINSIPKDNIKAVLPFAGDFETSHVAHNYPYGQLRTDMHYWTEYKKGKGFRPVTRSLNPKTGEYNKPHNGTYTEALALYLDNDGHIQFAHFSHYDREQAEEFYNTFESGLSFEGKRMVKYWQFVHRATELKRVALNGAEFSRPDWLEIEAAALRWLKAWQADYEAEQAAKQALEPS